MSFEDIKSLVEAGNTHINAKLQGIEARLSEIETKANRPGSAPKGFDALVQGFELKQVALHLAEGKALTGQTAEVVQEMKAGGGYQEPPFPWPPWSGRTPSRLPFGTRSPRSTRSAGCSRRVLPHAWALR